MVTEKELSAGRNWALRRIEYHMILSMSIMLTILFTIVWAGFMFLSSTLLITAGLFLLLWIIFKLVKSVIRWKNNLEELDKRFEELFEENKWRINKK